MALFRANTFVGQKVELDGHTFDGNRFERCVMVYGGGPLNMTNNALINVQWEFVGAAARTIALLSSFYQQGGEPKQFVEVLLSTFGKKPAPPSPATQATPSSA